MRTGAASSPFTRTDNGEKMRFVPNQDWKRTRRTAATCIARRSRVDVADDGRTDASTATMTRVHTMDAGAGPGTSIPGAPLRDRATLPSPLRGLAPAGGSFPSRGRPIVSAPIRWSTPNRLFGSQPSPVAASPSTPPSRPHAPYGPAPRRANTKEQGFERAGCASRGIHVL